MTAIAWQWSWPGVDTHLLVSQDVANLLERYRQRRFDVERGDSYLSTPQALPDWYLPWRLPIEMIGLEELGWS